MLRPTRFSPLFFRLSFLPPVPRLFVPCVFLNASFFLSSPQFLYPAHFFAARFPPIATLSDSVWRYLHMPMQQMVFGLNRARNRLYAAILSGEAGGPAMPAHGCFSDYLILFFCIFYALLWLFIRYMNIFCINCAFFAENKSKKICECQG